MHALILTLHEDNKNSQQVAESLKRSGHNVILCQSFTEALGVLADTHVDLIISDVHLENGGSVFDFLRWVRRNPPTGKTPFVLFSSRPTALAKYLEDSVRTSARLLGAAMYITMEDFDADEFRKQIDSLLPVEDHTIELSAKGNSE